MAITTNQKTKDEQEVVVEVGEEKAGTYLPHVWNLIRWINKNNTTVPDQSQWSVSDVNNYLDQLYSKGYKLFNTHYLGEGDGAYGIMYILVWEPGE